EPPAALAVPGSVRGEFGRSTPVNPRAGTHYQTYHVDIDADQLVMISASSDDFATSLTLYSPDGTMLQMASSLDDWGYQLERSRLIRQTVSAGTYTLVVSAEGPGQVGQYALSLEHLREDAELTVPGEARGYLAGGTGRSHPYTGAAMRVYPISVEEAVTLDLRLASEDFDAFLTLVEADSQDIVAENDDWGGSTDSRILIALEPGDYELWATGFFEDSAGLFTVSASEREIQTLSALGEDGFLNDVMTDSRQPIPGSGGMTGNPYPLSVEEPIVLDLQMLSHDLDPYLFVLDANQEIVGEDDDSAGSLNARLLMPLEPGEYTVWASSFSESGRGDFQILTETHQPDDFEGSFIGDYILGDSAFRGTGSSSGCGCGYDW
ncbi:MAG: hypothetical protein LAT62_06940, partial [Natronospirillum sp.]|nr:hypothetical protein [Natronospirillum sp.]